ncbi:hypothetical protein M3Y99_00794900 [Aphelenchoides fujianensis]|nr:hypothetical protein M3Y99_00794900 [Aphelenchoides fujianensis]
MFVNSSCCLQNVQHSETVDPPGGFAARGGGRPRDRRRRPKSTLFSGNQAAKKTSDTPAAAFRQPVHELQTDANRRIDLAGVVGERRAVGGTAQAEQLINELYSASQINRGPAGFCPPSRLHLDMLLGRDEAIGYSDYLNFSEHQV